MFRVVGIALISIFVIVGLYFGTYRALMGIGGIIFLAVYGLDEDHKDESLDPNFAAMLSFAPGFGHIYLGMRRRASIYALTYPLIIFPFLLIFPYSQEALFLFWCLGAFMLFSMIASRLDVERICKEMSLGHICDSMLEKATYGRMIFIVTIVIVALTALMTLLVYLCLSGDRLVEPYVMIWMIWGLLTYMAYRAMRVERLQDMADKPYYR